ncbi:MULTISPECIES: peroxidase-related enzyme [Arcicella]|uniref:Peroxidase-related enzyme n=1 Tax=Arcicella aquatica TaxID=217141 RepID=A0ABU5QLT3_9BACT|nr:MULTISPECIES: peroxidase-related enzyme [Arcicella]MDR6561163.1 putative peroxidase-related enzyme [Arcicella sp. BE51]MDR6811047.1 putative peroxidase-related enzyme [Arcicella sp. BE140]MDR6822397.1 putative peroxidase-related enzyme [Arcicella sp. BE139]MEA5258028.1 peroxidase-related enzyme [Arcicella aquatica]
MPHIQLPENVPGIRSLVMYRPDTGKPLYQLAQILLREDSPLSPAERELIATYVSNKNTCTFCSCSHAAAARYLYQDEANTVDLVLEDYQNAPISDKIKALLTIAGKVQADARTVSEEDIQLARSAGANDRDIHDTVLIAATFCMFNRYVDGLATLTPTDSTVYAQMGERMGTLGYVLPTKS